MEVLGIIILLIIVIFQARKIETLEAKLKTLQKQLKKYKEDMENGNIAQVENQDKTVSNENKTQAIPTKKIEPKPKMDSATSRNLSILITGSVLIVLAAIVFLTTAWQTIPDFIKTVVLFLVAFVFIGASKLSKEKYHLEKASKTFFYIGMAYLPICLLSISIFGLFGEFLSAAGDGKYIYLGFSTLVLSLLYYFISKRSNDRYLFYGSLLSQILSVILFTLLFEERILLVCINLLLYNLLLMLVTKDTIFEKIINIIPIIVGTIAICTLESGIDDISWYFIFTCVLLSINFIGLELKNSNIMKSLAFNAFLFLFGYCLIFKRSIGLEDGTCQVLITLFTVAVFIIENLIFSTVKENKNLLISSRVVPLISIGFIYFATIIEQNLIIPDYILGILFEVVLVFSFLKSKNFIYKYLAYAFTNIVLINIYYNFLEDTELLQFIPMLTTTLIMLYEMFYIKNKDKFLPIYLAGFEALSLMYMLYNSSEANVILGIIFTIFVIYYNKKNNITEFANAVPLLCVLPAILYADLNEQFEIGIMLLATIGLTCFSVISTNINVYTVISGIYLTITSTKIDSEYFRELLYIVWSVMHVYFYKNQKTKDVFKALTAICVTILYYSIAKELKLLDFTLFQFLGIVISGMYILKGIIPKYNLTDVEVLEYVFWGIIYLSALVNYVDSRDGIIFSILILAVIFYSYYKKYGATFLAAIAAILVNAFALTREFWLSIPWWIYLLVIGGILVGFAVKNEANENKKKISVGSILKEIKDKVEK